MAPKEQKTIGSKIKEMSTLIGATCAILSLLWIGFQEYQGYNSQKEDYPNLKSKVLKQGHQIDSLIVVIKRLSKENISDQMHLDLIHGVLAGEMEDYIYDGIRFKKSYNNKLYYYSGGILYTATWDPVAYKYYYTSENGQNFWCR